MHSSLDLGHLEQPFIVLLERIELCDYIFNHSTPFAILRFRRTCKTARRAVDDYMYRTYDVNKHLLRYFTDPLGFRLLQSRTQAVISGSAALQFLDRTTYEGSDLDIYVTAKQAATVCNWIIRHGGKGYQYHKGRKDDRETLKDQLKDLETNLEEAMAEICDLGSLNRDIEKGDSVYRRCHVRRVINFKSTTQLAEKALRIQLIIAMYSPADTILRFHSTVVMNAVTYHGAYALYPRATFEERRTLVCRALPVKEEAVAKYEARGWRPDWDISEQELGDPHSSFHFEDRWFGDKKTWFIPFDVSEILNYRQKEPGTLPMHVDPLSLNSFSLKKDGLGNVKTSFSIFRPNFFEHSYTASSDFVPIMSHYFEEINCRDSSHLSSEKVDSYFVMLKEMLETTHAQCFA